jgi:hypothetical protein
MRVHEILSKVKPARRAEYNRVNVHNALFVIKYYCNIRGSEDRPWERWTCYDSHTLQRTRDNIYFIVTTCSRNKLQCRDRSRHRCRYDDILRPTRSIECGGCALADACNHQMLELTEMNRMKRDFTSVNSSNYYGVGIITGIIKRDRFRTYTSHVE